jgi:FAD/FMN-containing dehydrogenase
MVTTTVASTVKQQQLDAAAVSRLEQRLEGRLIRPGDAEYDAARKVWNGMIDRYPVLIIQAVNNTDVVAGVNFAREKGLLLAVRGGGHNVAGHGTCDGGLVIDLARMNQVEVNPVTRIARVGGGATWGQVDAATQRHGLATPGGVFSKTGVAGLTLGGGYGWLRNQFGLSCDNVVGAEVVTAQGEIIYTNEHVNRDLLWGLRGGGGNFGIVTTFEYQLHPIGPEVAFVFALHDGEGERMKQAIQLYRDYCATAPDAVSTIGATGIIPPEPELFPVEMHGRPFVLLGGLYVGPVDEGQRILQPLLDLGKPLVDASGIKPYVEVQQTFDHDYPDGRRYYWKSLNVQSMDDTLVDLIVEHSRRQPSPFSTIDLWHIGGAVKRVSQYDSTFHQRQAAFVLNAEANWLDEEDDDANIHWVRSFVNDLQPYSDGSRYLNFAGFQEEGNVMMQNAFGQQYARLAALKRKYDPDNLFRLNANVRPMAQATA